MTTKRDYYEILGVQRTATEEDIRKAFRQKAFQFHPDRNKEADANERFKEVNEAYQVLTDAQRRAQYDRLGHAGVAAGARPGAQDFEGFENFGGLGDIFEAFFGNGANARTTTQGADLAAELHITFEEAVFGAKKEITVERAEICDRCKGIGGEPGTRPEICPNCRGSGRVRRTHRSIFGQFVQEGLCNVCNGRGSRITSPCIQCKGAGRERKQRKLNVDIPAGIHEGVRIQLRGQGDSGLNGAPGGDLYLNLRVEPHPFFEREGHDILLNLDLAYPQLALGDELAVPTLEGELPLKVPAGTQPGTVFRLKGQGVPFLDNDRKRGDQLITVNVAVPTSLSPRQKELMEELKRSFEPQTHGADGKKSWFKGGFKNS